ncbi:hypothetical protein [Rhizobium sp. AN80A]|uniref:hypothetical protein n=1 Tax=Rhizobium sp. AN80A TaxID=3040673 RepID=UPI0024B3B237|nr:hypothetical protein [Rhizobium sp. AN80A]
MRLRQPGTAMPRDADHAVGDIGNGDAAGILWHWIFLLDLVTAGSPQCFKIA